MPLGSLGQYVCCVPKKQKTSIPVISNIRSDAVNAKCKSPGQVTSVLYELSDIQNKASQDNGFDYSSFWDTNSQFMKDCQKKVFDQDCTADAQCYSGKCDTKHSKKCAVTWGEEFNALVPCYLDLMPSDLAFELKSYWGLPAVYPNASVEATVFAQTFQDRLFSLDCTG